MTETADNLAVTERFYAALAAADARALLELLDPSFRAELTDGLPEGWGGVYTGAHDMLERGWGPIFRVLDSRPVAQEYLACGPDRLVVLGRYQGRHRGSGRALDAAFAHVLDLAGGRIRSLRQITDSARWHDCVRGDGDETR
ncbi:MAG TPA: nuclear transport factor 2 family protein [Solirubrobacteraceae bacterium]|nr:nuclear transport factor 2 family protein [Solirubrobacteraceae bacterium]